VQDIGRENLNDLGHRSRVIDALGSGAWTAVRPLLIVSNQLARLTPLMLRRRWSTLDLVEPPQHVATVRSNLAIV
jgi:hypothetical protein